MPATSLAKRLARLLAVASLLNACTGVLRPDTTERINDYLERRDREHAPNPPSPYFESEKRLWQDEPQYVALLEGPPPAKRMRLISAVAPDYPLRLRLAHVGARVILVSFIVGTDGQVEAARILESSDERFNESALNAIRRFTFLPPQGPQGPTREIAFVPFDFAWSHKAAAATSH